MDLSPIFTSRFFCLTSHLNGKRLTMALFPKAGVIDMLLRAKVYKLISYCHMEIESMKTRDPNVIKVK